jgi:hypothetical protein
LWRLPSVKAWFARHPRFQVHFAPTAASWLNLVERFIALLTTRREQATIRDCGQAERLASSCRRRNGTTPRGFAGPIRSGQCRRRAVPAIRGDIATGDGRLSARAHEA